MPVSSSGRSVKTPGSPITSTGRPVKASGRAAKSSGSGVQCVERVFELLELITDAGSDVTLSELSSSTDLPLPTIHRLLRTLVVLGYARQLPNRRYALGPRLIRLGAGANKQFGALARPQLKSLVDGLGESANMAVFDSDMVGLYRAGSVIALHANVHRGWLTGESARYGRR